MIEILVTEPRILCAYVCVCEWYLCWILGNIVNILCTLLWLCCVMYLHWIYGNTVNLAAWVCHYDVCVQHIFIESYAIQWIFFVHYCGCVTHLLLIQGNTVNIAACVHMVCACGRSSLNFRQYTWTFCVHCCGRVWHIFVEFMHHHELSCLCAYVGCTCAWVHAWVCVCVYVSASSVNSLQCSTLSILCAWSVFWGACAHDNFFWKIAL